MKKRMFFTVGAMLVFIAVIGWVKFSQIQTAIAQASSFQPPPEAVTTTVARSEEWPATLKSIGSAVAVQGVTVAADLPGIVEKIAFQSGHAFELAASVQSQTSAHATALRGPRPGACVRAAPAHQPD